METSRLYNIEMNMLNINPECHNVPGANKTPIAKMFTLNEYTFLLFNLVQSCCFAVPITNECYKPRPSFKAITRINS